MLLRLPIAFFVAIFVALALFYAMHYMISHGSGKLNRSDDYSVVEFVRIKRDDQTRLKKRVIPEKPPLPKKPPPPPKMNVAEQTDVQMPQLDIDIPKISARGVSGGPFIGGVGGGGGNVQDGELIALVKIDPRYPRKAALNKIEGWVKVEFTVTELGTVTDVKIVDAKPRRIFNRAAKRAVLKWKFKPKVVDGKAVARRAVQVIEFTLAKDD